MIKILFMVESNTSTTQSYNQELIQWGGGRGGDKRAMLPLPALAKCPEMGPNLPYGSKLWRPIHTGNLPSDLSSPSSDFLDQPLI